MPSPALMTDQDLGPLSTAAPGERIFYGPDPLQFGELLLPDTPAPCPVVVNIHGGAWMSAYTIEHSRAQARALVASGFAVWNIEYRRVGDAGGGWPGTFQDVSRATDHLGELAKSHPLDLSHVCVMGHSAGGQLALWVAARRRLPRGSQLYVEDPLALRGVVALAPATELAEQHDRAIFDGIVTRLMGGSPGEVPERYAWASPARLAPSGVPQVLIVGRHDEVWGWNAHSYYKTARAAGEPRIELIVMEAAGHFELIAPQSPAWNAVTTAVHGLLRD